jgi:DNA repair protein RadD
MADDARQNDLVPSEGAQGDPDVSAIAKQVRDKTIERGRLTKSEVLLLFPLLPPDRYPDLKKAMEKFSRDIETGPRKIGGFVAKYHRRGRPRKEEEGVPHAHFELAEWEQLAVAKLVELLTRTTLEDLLGNLKSTVRKLREIQTGKDIRSRVGDLANALLIMYGRDLLAEKRIRAAVAKACGAQSPGSWHPGKESAIEFVQHCGFPLELAGVLAPDRQPDYERLEGRVTLKPLLDFQAELHAALLHRILRGRASVIATLPTGAGKTRLAVEAIKDYWKSRRPRAVIWLAHTEELCEQAYQCFKEVWENSSDVVPVTSIRYWGNYSRSVDVHAHAVESLIEDRVLVVSTPGRMLNALMDEQSPTSQFVAAVAATVGAVVVDEAHRAGAPTYQSLLAAIRGMNTEASFIGLTATPYRTEYVDAKSGIEALQGVFTDELLEASSLGLSPRKELQAQEVLAHLEIRELKTEIELRLPITVPEDLDTLSVDKQENLDRDIQNVTDDPNRRLVILPYLLEISRDLTNSILYFGPTVTDAQMMAFLLRERGISAAFVGAATRTATRRQTIQDFKEGSVKVLCNCEVLTTGFDAPRVTHLVIARPTVSRVLWEQMIGRGLRGPKFGGTERCVVYDCVDNFIGDPGKVEGFNQYRASWRKQLSEG